LDGPTQSELTRAEASEIKEQIGEQRLRRKKFVTRSLSVRADGIERARIDLAESNRVRFDIEADVNLIELVGHNKDGELLLATHLMTHDENDVGEKQVREYSILLEGGQRISLLLAAKGDQD